MFRETGQATHSVSASVCLCSTSHALALDSTKHNIHWNAQFLFSALMCVESLQVAWLGVQYAVSCKCAYRLKILAHGRPIMTRTSSEFDFHRNGSCRIFTRAPAKLSVPEWPRPARAPSTTTKSKQTAGPPFAIHTTHNNISNQQGPSILQSWVECFHRSERRLGSFWKPPMLLMLCQQAAAGDQTPQRSSFSCLFI